jgi:propanol-preferring alcohol dehydrogenase
VWDGDIDAESPKKLDNIIDTATVWKLVVGAMCNPGPVGRLVINVIRKVDIDKESLLKLDYPSRRGWKKKSKMQPMSPSQM